MAISPTSFSESVSSGEQVVRTLTITNQGGSDLSWRLTAGADTLESILTALDTGFSSITDAIPGRYAFSEGETGDHIDNGGAHMYDGGNYLRTERGGPLPYTNGTIVAHAAFGPSGRYFTRKYPGLFVLAADLDAVQEFTIDGDLGANGTGSMDTTVTQYLIGGDFYLGFVRRVYGAGGIPSVNHMILVQESASLGIQYSSSTASDFHRLSGLGGTRRLYYLLYAGENGGYIDDEAATRIMGAFLDTLGVRWLRAEPRQGTVPAGGGTDVSVTFDAAGLFAGGYDSAMVLSSNDPDEASVSVPAHLDVTGDPELDVSPTSLDFGAIFLGGSATQEVDVQNTGTDILTIGSVSSDRPEFAPAEIGFTVPPGQTHTLPVTFTPGVAGPVGATLTLSSDDADEPEVSLTLQGTGLVAPDIAVSPTSYHENLVTGETASRTLTIANTGGVVLNWHASRGGSSTLEDMRDRLEAGVASILDAIPGRYAFSEGEVGTSISDGGGDMYDGGNFLYTDLGGPIPYTNGPIVDSAIFGTSGRYFTRKFPGLFVLAADLSGDAVDFHVAGDLGADGGGSVDGTTLQMTVGGVRYVGFVKRVFGAGDPSVNHLIILEQRTGLEHVFASSTNNDMHRVFDLSGSTRLYYLLYGGSGGRYINDAETQGILAAFLGLLGPRWLTVGLPQEGALLPGAQTTIPIGFDATGMTGGDYDAGLRVTSDDPDESEITVPAHLHVTGAADVDVSPLSLDFGAVFVGGTSSRTVAVRNQGTDVLHVSAVAFDHGDFAADSGSFSLPVGATRTLTLTFAPGTATPALATMTLVCDDPDEPEVAVSLQGVGLVPPDVAVSPQSFAENLFTGETVTRTLTIENTGGSDLTFEAAAGGPTASTGTGRTLLLQDTYPWDSEANQFILEDAGIPYDVRSSSNLPSLDLSLYDHILVAGDQTTFFYQVFANNRTRIDDWVSAGGVLEFHAAGFGWQGGNASLVTLPGGMHIVHNDEDENPVLMPNHPIAAGLPNPLAEIQVSLAYFTDVPGAASVVTSEPGGNPTLVFYRHGAGHVVASGHPLEYAFPQRVGSHVLINMTLWANDLRSWLAVDPASGTVPAGGSATLSVLFDARGLIGGDYDASVLVTSNDPDEPTLTLPAALHVTGAPDLEVTPALIDFGAVFMGAAPSRTVSVTNAGTDFLTVSAVTLGHRDFSTDLASFTLAVGETRTLTVTFAPTNPGPASTTLVFASNDPDEPTAGVALHGEGREAPVLVLSPASFSEDLLTGGTVTRTLTIGNRGNNPLTFSIAVAAAPTGGLRPAPPPTDQPRSSGMGPRYAEGGTPVRRPSGMPSSPPASAELGAFPVLLVQSGGDPEDLRQRLLQFPDITDVDIFDALHGTPTLEHLRPYAAVLLSDTNPFYNPVALGDVLADYVDTGGSVVLLLASFVDNWSVRGRFMDEEYSPFRIGSGPLGSSTLGTYDASHPIMRGVHLASADLLGSAPLATGAQVVASWSNGLRFVATQGSRVAAVNVFTAEPGYWSGDIPLILHNALFWAASVDWLSAAPLSGTVPPGQTREITLTFDAAGMNGGDYSARLVVTTDDPLQLEKRIPVTLHVTGAPDIEVTPPSLEFGTLFVGASAVRTVTVANRGTDDLTISTITFDAPDFATDAGSFVLAPHQSRNMNVTWSPGAPGAVAATMTVASDDVDEPAVPVSLGGLAVIAPDVGVSPASFDESLFTGETVARTLSIENTGGSDLTFQVSVSAGPSLTGRRVLLVQDVAPWNSNANQAVLQAAGIPYDMVGSAGLPTVELRQYAHVIVASDQPTIFYQRVAANRTRIEDWVRAGGVLEFHAAGWGFSGGDASLVTLPGGMHIVQRNALQNFVLLPDHPLVEGVASPIAGTSASHASFADIPLGATAVVADEAGTPNLVVYRFGAGTVVAGGQTFEFQFPVWGSSRILQNMIPWANGQLDWLGVEPVQGTVPPGGSAPVTVTFDAGGLVGGDYHGVVHVTSNDPDEPELTVPANLHVTGAPDIEVSPPALQFDPIFVGATATKTLTVTNVGTDLLAVSSVTLDHPFFTVDASSFTLAVGASRTLTIRFAPTAPQSAAATLVLSSNDPDHAELVVPLQGVGLIAPDVAVSPGALQESLFTGETVTRTLTLENTGGSDLTFQAAAAGEPAGPGRTLLLQNNQPWYNDANQVILNGFGIAYDIRSSAVLPTLDLSPYDHIVVAGDQPTSFYQVFAANGTGIDAWVRAGGVLEFHAAGFGWQGGNASLVTLPGGMQIVQSTAHVNQVWMPDHPLVAGLPSPIEEYQVSLAHFTHVPGQASVVTSDPAGNPTLVFYRHGSGHVVAGGQAFEYEFPNRLSGQILVNMIQWADGLQSWLAVDPQSGVVPAGGSTTLSVHFDAGGLIGGDYAGSVVVSSNDPDEPAVTVPAALHVTGAPDIEVTPEALVFDPVFVGGTATKTLTVTNAGTDVLTVSAVDSQHPAFTVDVPSFALPVGGTRTLTITFAPAAPESASAMLVLASDDPDEPEVSIPLEGVGLIAPDVAVSPPSFDESLFASGSVTRTLVVENTGGSPLDFEISVQEQTGALPPGPAAPAQPEAGQYSGTYLSVGVSDYGEVMPFQSPLGIENLQSGTALSGHTIAYTVDGLDRLSYAVFDQRSGVVAESFRELRNTPEEAQVEAVSRTADGALRLTQTFTFRKATRYVLLKTRVTNLVSENVSDVVLKWVTDWDVQGDFVNTWDYDRDRNAVLAWDGSYVAVAGVEPPAIMDLDGWDDFDRRLTNVGVPAGPVDFDGAALLHFQLGDLAPGAWREVSIVYAAAPDLPTLGQAIDAGRGAGWLHFQPVSGTVPPGTSRSVQVTFDATGLIGGDYAASIVVTSNDPDESAVSIPAALHVTGAPDIEVTPAALVFDPVFLGGTAQKTLTVRNGGTDVLTVAAVTSDHPDFTVDPSSFTLPVGTTRTVTVTFAPTAPGSAAANLLFASDDPDEPQVSVSVQGVGLVAPDVAVLPPSFSESLFTGETVTRTLSIENTGESDLSFEVSIGTSPAGVAARRTLLLGDLPPWGSQANQIILDALGIPYDVRGANSLPTLNLALYDHILVAGDQTTFFYEVFAANRTRIEAWVIAGGVLDFHAAGFGWQGGNASLVTLPGGMRIMRHTVDQDQNRILLPNHPLVAGVPNPMEEYQVSIAHFTDLPAGASVVTEDLYGHPTLVFYRHGAGHVVASGHPLEYDFPYRQASLVLLNMIQWADGLQSWLSVLPVLGTVAPGTAATVSVLFDAGGLTAGEYTASVVVTSNDPDETTVTIPAALHVTGAPDVDVTPPSLQFGTVFVGETATQTFTVNNLGTDLLTVTGIPADHGDFSAQPATFSLAPGGSQTVTVTYAPSGSGSVTATLLVASNDPDRPTVPVALAGNAILPGDLGVDPLAIEETVRPGTVVTRTLTLTNTGDADLAFQIHIPANAVTEPSLLLVTAGADVGGLRQELSGLTGLGAVDVFDGAQGTPSLAQLVPYGAVVLISGLQVFNDPEALGNALADYVDGGGAVIVTFSSFVSGWEVSGRFGAGGYLPFTLATALLEPRALGAHDEGHPIFLGVSSVVGFPSNVGLAQGAQLVGEWTGGLPFVASQGLRVVGLNIYLASPGTWQGPVAALIRNAALWAAGRQGTWVSVVPRTGVLHGGASLPVTVTLDASQLQPGQYSSPLVIESNDGDKPSLVVPVTLSVADCVPAAEHCNGMDDDCDGEVDEGLPTLTCGVGACMRTVESCVSGVPQTCIPGAPAEESCNGMDDDCDGVPDDGGDVLCDDGDPCTSDTCHQSAGCVHEISGACHASPRGVGFWRRLCQGPHPDGEITPADLDCVQETCTFAGVQTIADMCARLDPPPGDPCTQADAQLMALTLNHCQGRIVDTAPILSACAATTTLGQSRAEVDRLLCAPLRDPTVCKQAHCQAEEINSGRAQQANSLRLRRTVDGKIRLEWAPPYWNAENGPPEFYRVRRRSGSEAPFEDLIETPDVFYVDGQAAAIPSAQYEVTPVWK